MITEALYVHIPFCDHICGYCAFNRFLYNRTLSDDFMQRIVSQIDALENSYKTIYVGGGTPTSLQSDQLEILLQALKPKLQDDYEWTFEANPENLTEDKILLLKKYGVNRMSLGVQTSKDDLLEKIGRPHKFYDAKEAVKLLKKHGLDNFSLDLIYGLPGQSIESFQESMCDVIALGPKHIAIYALTIDKGSEFERRGVKAAPLDVETKMYQLCIETMEQAGYEHYEVSNFALPGYRSQHNQVYWRYENYDALGPGASMKHDRVRKTWTRFLTKYNEQDAFDEILHLSPEEERFEFMMMGLRMKDGISHDRFEKRFHQNFYEAYPQVLKKKIEEGYLEDDGKRIYATEKGLFFLDNVLLEFMD